jgi:unsaturated rhamnogalacturonyl hydrolase
MKSSVPRSCAGGGAVLAILLLASLSSCTTGAAPAAPEKFGDATATEWSVRMANSEIKRLGQPAKPKWDYTSALFATSLLELGDATKDTTYGDYAAALVGGDVAADGSIAGYKASDHSLDEVAPARALLALYRRTQDPRYAQAARLVRAQFNEQPRTSDGGFWHKQIYPNQMWLDGLYMGEPFYADYAKTFNEPADFDDITKQILLADQHTYDAKTGLFYHGWEDTRQQTWADPATGHSPSFWGRADGWYAMAIVDVLDDLPADHPNRAQVLEVLRRLADGVAQWQDAPSGLWWQVLDQGGRAGNYWEASASSMFVYALAKAVNQGYLPAKKYAAVARRGFAGLVRSLVKTEADGTISLTQVCVTAGLGSSGANSTYRDGSYDYYVRQTQMASNDLKGVGPFILAGLEVARLGPETSTPDMPATAPDLAPGQVAQMGWAALPTVLAHIQAPVFPDKNFPITDYGAKADGATDCTDAIRQAIAACHQAGGGHVIVPNGKFLTGGIRLLSNVDLHLADQATLQFVVNPAEYPKTLVRHEGVERTDVAPPIYAFGQENIAVTGKGTLDGGGEANWVAAVGSNSRPNFVVPIHCKNVLIDGLTVHNSPMWEINPVYCTNVIVRNLNISSHDANNDGCDPDSCRYVLIDGCTFDTGDDCIAIKCGKDDDGRRVNLPTEFVIVRNCTMKDGHGGVTLGSECTPAIRNVFIENCRMDSPNLNAFIRCKDSPLRGGIIENIFMRDVRVGTVSEKGAGILIEYTYQDANGAGGYVPILRNVDIRNVTGAHIPILVKLTAGPTAVIENIQVTDCVFQGPDPVVLQQYPGKITFRNVTIPPPGAAP